VIPCSSSQVDSSGFEWIETVSESTIKTGWRMVGLLFFDKRDLAGLEAFDLSSSMVSYTEEREMCDLEYLRQCPVPGARARTLFLATVDIGCVALDNAKLICERSILDCDPPEFEDPSDDERGGVSPPELEVQVLERERAVGAGLVNTGTEQSRITS